MCSMITSIANSISFLLVGFIIYPFICLIDSFSWWNVKYVLGLLLVVGFIKLAHSLPAQGMLARPKGACNCGITNGGGSYEHRSGMPSGHVMTTTYILCMIAIKSNNLYTSVVSVALIISMMVSRVVKKCHTIPQVIAGALLGFASSTVVTYF